MVRQIHQEPVKVGVCDKMENYYWSSYRFYLKPSDLVDRRLILDSLHFGGGYVSYMEEETEPMHMLEEVPLRYGRSDDEAAALIQVRLQEEGYTSLKQLEQEERDEFLKKLKYVDEVSIQQLSRVTGVNRGHIQRL